jgi:hypothetical protein
MTPKRIASFARHPPARLVGHDLFGLRYRLANALVNRLATGGGPQDGVDAAATVERDLEEALQAAGDLAVGQAGLLVKFDDGRLGIGSKLSSGGAKGVGRLQRMASLNPAAAPTALADVDVELPVNGLARDLDLELLGDVGLIQGAAAVGTRVWQGCLVDLVNLFGGTRLTVGLGAVLFAGLAARLLGLAGRLALGEGGGLTLPGTGGLVKLAAEALVLCLQVVEAPLQG